MAINTQTLIHFTNKLENLESILSGDFLPQMSVEDTTFIGRSFKVALPMVCFCDIPLHLVSEHMAAYGKYGIGLSKDWGIRSGLNPVVYLVENSPITESFRNVVDFLLRKGNQASFEKSEESIIPQRNLAFDFINKIKPYSGKNPKTGKDKVFYDECEWRFCPNIFDIHAKTGLIPFFFEEDLAQALPTIKSALKKFPLTYSPNDIRYIFVESEEEIFKVASMIDTLKGMKYEPEVLTKLKTKITVSKYVLEDT
jgi:hypothetical protein